MSSYLSGNEIREKFLRFFEEEHQSTRVKSSSLVPDNPTVLLTTAGMLQFVPIFLGYEKPPYSPARATSCQKCARAGGKDSDIENVGRTPRHHTFFEMLGNFSFGDYFKKEIIPWSWDFVLNHLKLDKDRLWITIYQDDNEAFELWKQAGVAPERILRKGKKDNFWGPPGPTGPCGPCTEIHYDLGKEFACSETCSIDTCECDRWVEIWNLVFMELFQDEQGNLTPLEKKNVDTGMGLERISMIVQGKTSTFETDLIKPILDKAVAMSGKTYGKSDKDDVSLRIIADHARCVTFMISDGIVPGNEGVNYVLRMILRRALRHGKMLGLELPFLHKIVDVIVENYKGAYPELNEKRAKITEVIKLEEERFKLTLDKGQKLLEEIIPKALCTSEKTLAPEDAFKLYDTFGFPLELTIEIAHESGLSVDKEGFDALMKEQKERAKAAAQKVVLTDDLVYVQLEEKFGKTEFIGYENNRSDGKVIAIVSGGKPVESVQGGEIADIILDRTPFYAESGGQIGDIGVIAGENFDAKVLNTFKVNKLFVHRAEITSGEAKTGDEIKAQNDEKRRYETTLHHSSAHLLQAALLKVLGNEVKQAGSYVEPNRTRFDFSFSRAMTKDEISKVETLVNEWIAKGFAQKTEVMNIEEAKKSGAVALFDEKYDDNVRVVSFSDVSKELCGGCHAKNTSDLRLFKITSESAISQGVRRIESICSETAFEYLNEKAKITDNLAHELKAPFKEVEERIRKMQDEIKSLQSELSELKSKSAQEKFSTFLSRAEDIQGGKLFISKLEDYDADAIKKGMELLESKLGNSIIVLVSVKKDSLSIFSKVSGNFVEKGINASQIVSKIAQSTGGKGGGRPNAAQGGGKDASNIDNILAEVEQDLKKVL